MSNDELFNFAFGWNGYGQVGTTGTRPQVNEPERLELQTDDDEAADDYEMEAAKDGVEHSPFALVDVAAGPFHSAAVDAGGRVWTWGNGRDGQLGHSLGVENTQSNSDALDNVEERVPRCLRLPGVRFGLVACGTSHTLALTRGGVVFGWGSNSQGQLGIEAHSTASNNSGIVVHPEPIPDTFGVVLVAAGGEFSCAIVEMSGSSRRGIVEEPESEELPVAAGLGARRAGTESGSPPPPAPKRRRRLLTWGSNEFGQLGRIPVQTCPWTHVPGDAGLDGPIDVACGLDHVVALASGGALYASGRGNDGQLGSGKRQSVAAFTRLEAPLLQGHGPFCKVAAGMSSSAAVSYDGRLFTWGDNSSFQLGFGDDELRLEPTPTAILGCVDVGIGDECCVCVVEDAAGQAKLFAVGHSGGGRLGIGDVPLILTTRAATRMQSLGRQWLASRRVAAKRRSIVESVVASLVDAAVQAASTADDSCAEGAAMVGGAALGGGDDGEEGNEGGDSPHGSGAVMYWDDLDSSNDRGQEDASNEGSYYDGDEGEDEREQDDEEGDDAGKDHPRLVKAPTGSELTASFYHQIVSCFHDDAWPPIKSFEHVAIPDESWHSLLRLRKLAVGGCHVIGCGWLTMRDDDAAAASSTHAPPSSKSRAGWYANLQFRKCCNATCDVTFPEPLIDLHEMICKAVDEEPSVDADPPPIEEDKDKGAVEEPPPVLVENAEGAIESAADSPTPDPEGHSDPAESLPATEAQVDDGTQEGPVEEEAVEEGEPEPVMKVIRKRVGGGWKNVLVPDTDAAPPSGGGGSRGGAARPRQQPVAGSAVGAARALRDV